MFFIAVEQSIHVYRTAHPLEEEIEPFKKLKYDGMTVSSSNANSMFGFHSSKLHVIQSSKLIGLIETGFHGSNKRHQMR